MTSLPPEDRAHLEVAQGWIGLDTHTEANEELGKMAPESREHPDVLEVRWKIYASIQHWDDCLQISEALIKTAPERMSGWLTKSIALHGLNRIQDAFDTLSPVADKFSHIAIISYDLACYACRLGRVREATAWLQRAFKTGDASRLRAMALADPDLEPIRNEI